MIDGRILTGLFLCTDRDANIILGMCVETRPDFAEEERNLGLSIVPKKAIRKIEVDIAGDINEASIL
jgi:N-alpha-acetyltransferase 38, NatC auxiliary subunit